MKELPGNTRISLQLVEHGLRSAPTQYRLYGRPFLQVKRPNQQYQCTEGKISFFFRDILLTGFFLQYRCKKNRLEERHEKTKRPDSDSVKLDGHVSYVKCTHDQLSDGRRHWFVTWSCRVSGTSVWRRTRWSSRRSRSSRSSTGATWWSTRHTASRTKSQRCFQRFLLVLWFGERIYWWAQALIFTVWVSAAMSSEWVQKL